MSSTQGFMSGMLQRISMQASNAAGRVAKSPRADRRLAQLVELVKLRDVVDRAISEQLRALDAAGVTQVAIAKRLDVSSQAVSKRMRRAKAARAGDGGTDGAR